MSAGSGELLVENLTRAETLENPESLIQYKKSKNQQPKLKLDAIAIQTDESIQSSHMP